MIAKIKSKKVLKIIGYLVFAAAFIMPTFYPSIAWAAIPAIDLESINGDTVWYNPEAAVHPSQDTTHCGPDEDPNHVTSGPTGPGLVYMVGDSIGAQITNELTGKLTQPGWSFKSNSWPGRTLSGGLGLSGIATLEGTKDSYSNASAVVIELGTNAGGFTAENIAKAIDTIKSTAKNARIYWVDTAVVERQDYAKTLSNVNSLISSNATQKGYQVISWNKKVFGPTADPGNINAAAPDNGYIKRANQYVHLTDEGVKAMSELISQSVMGSAVSTGAAAPDLGVSACTCGSAQLTGNTNEEKVYQFFLRQGLTNVQAAGIMGNMQAEAHFEPRLVEYGWPNSRGEKSVPGKPSSLDDTMPPNQNSKGQPGYGIVQWTSPGRKQGLIALGQSRGITKLGDLSLQLDYVMQELNGGYRSVYAQLKSATTAEAAAMIIMNGYEIPGDKAKQGPIRTNFARGFLAKYGSTTVTSGSSAPSQQPGGCQ